MFARFLSLWRATVCYYKQGSRQYVLDPPRCSHANNERVACLAPVGVMFTLVFTYTGFVLLAVSTMWYKMIFKFELLLAGYRVPCSFDWTTKKRTHALRRLVSVTGTLAWLTRSANYERDGESCEVKSVELM